MIRIFIFIFLAAAIIIGSGVLGLSILGKEAGMAFLLGSITLGGGFLICGLFSLKMRSHGIIGAGVLALLGAGRGVMNIPDVAKFITGDRSRGFAPLLELLVFILCALLLLLVYRVWVAEKSRKMLSEESTP